MRTAIAKNFEITYIAVETFPKHLSIAKTISKQINVSATKPKQPINVLATKPKQPKQFRNNVEQS